MFPPRIKGSGVRISLHTWVCHPPGTAKPDLLHPVNLGQILIALDNLNRSSALTVASLEAGLIGNPSRRSSFSPGYLTLQLVSSSPPKSIKTYPKPEFLPNLSQFDIS